MARRRSSKRWIQGAVKNKGSLRRTLKAKKGQKIPMSKLRKAAKGNLKTARRARLAITLRKMNRGKRRRRRR